MAKRILLVIGTLVLAGGLGVPAYGWNSLGHMAVAYVAYQQLTPQAKTRVDALLQLNPDYQNWLMMIPENTSPPDKQMMVFLIAATWPDEIKGEFQYGDDGTNSGNTPDGTSSSQNTGYRDLLRHKYWHFVDTPFTNDGTALPTGGTPEPVLPWA